MSPARPEPGAGHGGAAILALPERDALPKNLLLSAAFSAFFWSVYWTGDFVAGRAPQRFDVALPLDLSIPFLPWASLLYLTITPLLCLAPFIFRTPARLLPLVITMSLEVAFSGVVFCLFPVALSFPTHEVAGMAGVFYRLADDINLTYNCVPSLHVAFAVSAAWAYRRRDKPAWTWFVILWSGAIVLSTMLSHQHHIVDVATGALLAAAAMAWIYPRARGWSAARHRRAIVGDAASLAGVDE
jgi:membrane-associated phospholipid phosphatase